MNRYFISLDKRHAFCVYPYMNVSLKTKLYGYDEKEKRMKLLGVSHAFDISATAKETFFKVYGREVGQTEFDALFLPKESE